MLTHPHADHIGSATEGLSVTRTFRLAYVLGYDPSSKIVPFRFGQELRTVPELEAPLGNHPSRYGRSGEAPTDESSTGTFDGDNDE